MINFTPRTVTAVEENPPSVASYKVEVRDNLGTTVLASSQGHLSNPSGTTVIPVGVSGGAIPNSADPQSLIGVAVTIWVAQVGPSGDETPFVQAPGLFTVNELADGAESLSVQA